MRRLKFIELCLWVTIFLKILGIPRFLLIRDPRCPLSIYSDKINCENKQIRKYTTYYILSFSNTFKFQFNHQLPIQLINQNQPQVSLYLPFHANSTTLQPNLTLALQLIKTTKIKNLKVSSEVLLFTQIPSLPSSNFAVSIYRTILKKLYSSYNPFHTFLIDISNNYDHSSNPSIQYQEQIDKYNFIPEFDAKICLILNHDSIDINCPYIAFHSPKNLYGYPTKIFSKLANLHKKSIHHQTCIFSVRDKNTQSIHSFCHPEFHVIKTLSTYLNFTPIYHSYNLLGKISVQSGIIPYAVHTLSSPLTPGRHYFIHEYQPPFKVIYCLDRKSSSKSSFSLIITNLQNPLSILSSFLVWTRPFDTWTWIFILILYRLCPLILASGQFFKNISFKCFKSTFLPINLSAISKLGKLHIVSLSLLAIILAALYESKIISEAIVPPPIPRFQNVIGKQLSDLLP